jgi:hypothetical protein
MNDHIPDVTKMINDTPRTDAEEYESQDEPVAKLGAVDADFARQLERELNRACDMYRKLDIHTLNLVDRIIRLEAAGDAMERLLPDGTICDRVANLWRTAKEAKP